MLKPGVHLAGGQRGRRQCRKQLGRLRGVGARQRGQHPRRRPGGDRALAHGRKDAVGQPADEFQPSADPTHIATTTPRYLALGQPLAAYEFLQQQRFFHGREGASAGLREDRQQGLGEFAVPGGHPGGVAPQSAQCLHAPVAIDQDQPLAVGIHDGDAGNELTALFDGAGQCFNGAGFDQSRGSEPQFKTVQINFGCLGGCAIHGRHATRRIRPWR